MTNTGKIARLPKHLRDELNQRLDDGQTAEDILPWLNRLPECKSILAEKFDSRPITRQNLSQWKQGGYQTWLRVQQTREQVQSLFEQARDLEKDDDGFIEHDGMSIADRLGALVAVQLLTAIHKLDDIADSDQRWKRLAEIVNQLSRLRREDHHGRRVRLAEEQWSYKCERQEKQDEKDAKEAKRIELRTWFYSTCGVKKEAEFLGGGNYGDKWADWLHRLECDLPRPDWWKGAWINHRPPEHFDSNDMAPHGQDAQSRPLSKTVRQERRSPDRRDPKDSKPSKSGPSKKPDHLERNTTHPAKSRRTGRRRENETLDPSPSSAPIPSPVTRHAPASPKLPSEGGSLSSCKVNQSKSNQQHANVPSLANPAGQSDPDSSRHSLSEDGSKSNQPSADVTTNGNPLTRDPQPSSLSDHAAQNTEPLSRFSRDGTCNSPPPQQNSPLDTPHPPPK